MSDPVYTEREQRFLDAVRAAAREGRYELELRDPLRADWRFVLRILEKEGLRVSMRRSGEKLRVRVVSSQGS